MTLFLKATSAFKRNQKSLDLYFLFIFSEAADNGEAAKLESRLRSLSSGLIGLRHCLHEKGEAMLPPTFVASSNYLQGK